VTSVPSAAFIPPALGQAPAAASAPNTQPPWAHAPYSIKRHGLTLDNCDSEPVQTPGCIQSHGALLVLRITDLTVLQASENTADVLGAPAAGLLGRHVSDLLGTKHAARLRELLSHGHLEGNAVPAFTWVAVPGRKAMNASLHTSGGVAVLELEPGLEADVLVDGVTLGRLGAAVTRLQATQGVQSFCEQVTEEVRQLTGLDRVMVYRFHADAHGEVLAESRRSDLSSWLGLHYPESDVPRPAREIFKRIWIRPLPDAAGTLAELLPLANPDTGLPLDMSHCALRGASVMYTEYLANMGVAASLTMALRVDGELWGLIAGHHQTATAFPQSLRAACELLAQVASLQLKSAEQNELLAYRLRMDSVHQQLVALAAQDGDLTALVDHRPGLLDAIDAGGVALFHHHRWWCAGQTPDTTQLDELAAWLVLQPELGATTSAAFVTDRLVGRYGAAASMADVASGVLALRISRLRPDLMIWFRPQTLQTVHWAGHPHDKPSVPGRFGERLSPRRSFELFVESVHQRSLPWTRLEVDGAMQLRLLVMELVVSRSERLADLNHDLTRSNEELDAFAYVASHDLKEPLRGMHRYAHQLLESELAQDPVNRTRLNGLMRLTVRMDSLLDSLLHFARVGRTQLERTAVDLDEVLDEAVEMVAVRATRPQGWLNRPRRLPTLCCDRVRVREVFSNLLSNALKYSRDDAAQIEVGYLLPGEGGDAAHAPPAAEGLVLYVRDQGIGIEPRHHEVIFRIFKRLHPPDAFGGGVGAGLSIVQKVVQRHGGRVWVESTPGVGSTFYFTLGASPGDAADSVGAQGPA
jgi:chemotaxis family two-component system sensor kinase Cph1